MYRVDYRVYQGLRQGPSPETTRPHGFSLYTKNLESDQEGMDYIWILGKVVFGNMDHRGHMETCIGCEQVSGLAGLGTKADRPDTDLFSRFQR